jgi:hypothetical protein
MIRNIADVARWLQGRALSLTPVRRSILLLYGPFARSFIKSTVQLATRELVRTFLTSAGATTDTLAANVLAFKGGRRRLIHKQRQEAGRHQRIKDRWVRRRFRRRKPFDELQSVRSKYSLALRVYQPFACAPRVSS